jgi:hypothetical protein
MITLSKTDLAKYEHALHYPGVEASDFCFETGSYVLSKNSDGNWARAGVDLTSVSISKNGGGVRLNDASTDTPFENVQVRTSDGRTLDLSQRVPILGIGSNSSSDVLSKKFADVAGAQDIAVFPVKVPNHVVAHSAFLTEEGGIAVSIYPHQGGYTNATLGFYTKELANRLTGTEFNYDGVALNTAVQLPVKGVHVQTPLAYVSAWGVMTTDGQTPLGSTSIPGSLQNTMTTHEAIDFAIKHTDPTVASREQFMAGNITNNEERLKRTSILQRSFSLPAQIDGQRIFPAVKSGQPGFPQINYI